MTFTTFTSILVRECQIEMIETVYDKVQWYGLVYRSRRAEAHIQQMLWKVNYSDIISVNMVGIVWLLAILMQWTCLKMFSKYTAL